MLFTSITCYLLKWENGAAPHEKKRKQPQRNAGRRRQWAMTRMETTTMTMTCDSSFFQLWIPLCLFCHSLNLNSVDEMSVVALMFLSVNPCYCRHWIAKCMRCGVVRPFWRVTVTYYYYLDEFRAVDCVLLSLSICRWRRRNWLRFVTWRIRFSMPWNFVQFYFRTTHETHKRHTLTQTWIFTRVQISMQIIRQIRIRHHVHEKGLHGVATWARNDLSLNCSVLTSTNNSTTTICSNNAITITI